MIIHNGTLTHEDDVKLHITNRSFRYGDGCFESIRLIDGKSPFLNLHHERLLETAGFLKIKLPEQLNLDGMKAQIENLAQANKIDQGGYARLTLFRADGGFYMPDGNEANYLIEAQPLPHNKYVVNTTPLNIGVFAEQPKAMVRLSNFKTNNSLHYVLASIYMKEHGLDDCLLVNDHDNIVESSNSNVFVVHRLKVATPPLWSGCIDGVARRLILGLLRKEGIPIQERPITIHELADADEIIVTNAVRGPRFTVGQGRGGSEITNWMVEHINAHLAEMNEKGGL